MNEKKHEIQHQLKLLSHYFGKMGLIYLYICQIWKVWGQYAIPTNGGYQMYLQSQNNVVSC